MTAVAAVDLGATSGRVIVGRVEGGRLEARHVARFANEPVRLAEGLHWNLLELYRRTLEGLAAAEREHPGEIGSIGVDSWAVDYGLLRGGRLLGLPFHYRDGRSAAGVEEVGRRISPERLYRLNGLQHLPFNTIYQLAAEGEPLRWADRLLLLPDLLGYWLTGREAAERTNASTTGLLDPVSREWSPEALALLDVSPSLFAPLVDPGTPLAPLAPPAVDTVGRAIPVTAVASHDTASAVAAIPARGRDFAYVSCGTWGLVGLELDAPVLADEARRCGFTNEGGLDGRTRFLHNVMGLWLLTESLRAWEPAASAAERSAQLGELLEAAGRVPGPVPVFDVDDPAFASPGNMPARIAAWFRDRGEAPPDTRAGLVRSIVESLAEAFADSVREAMRLADRDVSVIHLVGGGAQNALLCQATADRARIPVLAGPIEATAMGNMLVQARTLGSAPPELEGMRAVVARSASVVTYSPR